MTRANNPDQPLPQAVPPKSYSAWIRRHRRTIGIPMVIAALILAKPQSEYLIASLALVILGESIRIWAAGHLRKEQILTTGGPYRWIRNPLYVGSFLIAIGFALFSGSWWIWILLFSYFLFCYVPVVQFEERTLLQKFGDEYDHYASAVRQFFPLNAPFAKPTTSFSWHQVLKNKEYNAVLGIIATYLILCLRS